MCLTVIYKYNITAVNLSPQHGELMQKNIQYYNTITIINQAFFRVGDLTKERDERGFVQRSANLSDDHTLAVIANNKAFSIASVNPQIRACEHMLCSGLSHQLGP